MAVFLARASRRSTWSKIATDDDGKASEPRRTDARQEENNMRRQEEHEEGGGQRTPPSGREAEQDTEDGAGDWGPTRGDRPPAGAVGAQAGG